MMKYAIAKKEEVNGFTAWVLYDGSFYKTQKEAQEMFNVITKIDSKLPPEKQSEYAIMTISSITIK